MEVIDEDFYLVPLPTIRKHIRERGFDHIKLLCKKTGLPFEEALKRRGNTVQVGASSEQRQKQAKEAYFAGDISDKRYLLVDDVWTTGSSMLAACEAMQNAGSKNLAIAVIARSL